MRDRSDEKASTNLSVTSRKKRRDAVLRVLQDYAESSTIHGVKYIGNVSFRVSPLGKFLWSCIVICGFIGMCLMTRAVWLFYANNPSLNYAKTFHAPIFLAPFPAVTICPSVTPSAKILHRLLKRSKLPPNLTSAEALQFFKYSFNLLQPKLTMEGEQLDKLKAFFKLNNFTIAEFVRSTVSCEDIIDSCWWQNERISCSSYVKHSNGYRKFCCSFNYLLEDYIYYNNTEILLPFYTQRAGRKFGLTITLNPDVFHEEGKENIVLSTNVKSMVISVHHHMEYPSSEISTYTLQAGDELQLGIEPVITREIENFKERNYEGIMQFACASNSKKLEYFPVYGHSNCFANCRIKLINNKCDCIPSYYSIRGHYSQKRTCELDDLPCVHGYVHNMPIVDYKSCICLNPCDDTRYQVNVKKSSIAQSRFAVSPIYGNLSSDQAILQVYMDRDIFAIWETTTESNTWNIAGSIGGILSLILGISIISVAEIVYFISLLCYNAYARK